MIHKLTIYWLYFIGFLLFLGILTETLNNFELLWKHIYSTWTIVDITSRNDEWTFLDCMSRHNTDKCRDRTFITFDVEFYDESGYKNITSESIIKRRQLDYDINLLNHKKWDIINIRYTWDPPKHIKLLTDFY